MIKNTIKLTIAFLLFFVSTQVLAVIFIDVGNFKAAATHYGIRVSIFDTTTQQYIYVGYYEKARATQDTERLPKLPYAEQLVIDYGGNIRVLDGFRPINLINGNPSEYIVRTRVTTKDGTSAAKITIRGVTHTRDTYESKAIEPISGEEIELQLNQFKGKQQRTGKVTIRFFSRNEPNKAEELELSTIKDVLGASDNSLLRELGELATEYTMIGYGYKLLPSQDDSHHGLDGVFINGDELFITESKCGEFQDDSAQKIAKHFLNLQCITTRIKEIPSQHSNTRMTVDRFLRSGKIFIFAHRIKENGQCECYVELFKEPTSSASASTSSSSTSSASVMDMVQGCEICFTGQASLDDFLSGIFTQLSLEDAERAEQCLHCLLAKKKQAVVKRELYNQSDLHKILRDTLLQAAKMGKKGTVDNTTLPGWTLYNPAPDGNCFFNAVYHQLQRMNHELIPWITQGEDSYNVLRANIQGLGFIPGTWADEEDIINLVRGFDVDVAVYYTDPSTQWYGGYTYYYVKQGIINRVRVGVGKLPRNRRIIRLAYTGTHYMSIISPDDQAIMPRSTTFAPEQTKTENSSTVAVAAAAAAAPMSPVILPADTSSLASVLILPLPIFHHGITNQSRLHVDLSYEIPQLPNTTQPISRISLDILRNLQSKAKGGDLKKTPRKKYYKTKDRKKTIIQYLKQAELAVIVINDNFKYAYPAEIRQVVRYLKIICNAVTYVLQSINALDSSISNQGALEQIDKKIQSIISVASKIQEMSQAIIKRERPG